MTKFLFTWELGSGLGHLANLQPIVNGLSGRGHEVELALCNLDRCEDYFPSISCRLAPLRPAIVSQHILEPSTYAEILYNAGCDNAERLASLVGLWREVFDDVRPDVLVAEFSPIAFLAAQGTGTRIVQMGTGHAWPPNVSPLPDLCPWRNNYPDRLAMIEQRVLEVINKHLAEHDQSQVDHVAMLFARADLQLLTTFAEMDHYPDRSGGNYVGNWSHLAGEKPEWPAGKKPRVFCYLKTPVAITTVLRELARREISTLAFIPEQEKFNLPGERGSVRITSRPVEISAVARECDLAVLHTGHGTTVQLLLAGKPILTLPLMGEQGIVAQNVVRLGAGLSVESDSPPAIISGLGEMLSNDSYSEAAVAFRAKHADFSRDQQIERVLDLLEQQKANDSRR